MTTTARLFLKIGSFNTMIAVILGAFATHSLKSSVTEQLLVTFNTGVQYHFYHSLGLLVAGLLANQLPESPWVKYSGWLMLAGILLFCGSLYLLVITDLRWLGIITPAGGLCFILAWAALALSVYRS